MLIEQTMIFVLGFLAALLLALMMLPALSRRAMRLARRRLELQLPLSPAEILAERDQLRAEHAVRLRQSEQRIEQAQSARAELISELGRRTAKLVEFENTAKTLAETLARSETELSETSRSLNEIIGEAGAIRLAHYDEAARHDQTRESLARLNDEYADLANRHNDLKAVLAGLEAAKAGLELQCAELQRHIRDIEHKLAVSQQENAVLAQERDLGRLELENSAKQREKLAESLRAGKAANEAVDKRLDKANARLKLYQIEISDLRQLNEALQQGGVSYEHRLKTLTSEHTRIEDTLERQVENLKSEIAALEGALAAARDARTHPKPGKTETQLSPSETRLLRDTLSEVAAKVVRQSIAREGSKSRTLELLTKERAAPKTLPSVYQKSLAERILDKSE